MRFFYVIIQITRVRFLNWTRRRLFKYTLPKIISLKTFKPHWWRSMKYFSRELSRSLNLTLSRKSGFRKGGFQTSGLLDIVQGMPKEKNTGLSDKRKWKGANSRSRISIVSRRQWHTKRRCRQHPLHFQISTLKKNLVDWLFRILVSLKMDKSEFSN